MIKVVGIVTLLASSLVVGVFGGGFSSNGELSQVSPGATRSLRSIVSFTSDTCVVSHVCPTVSSCNAQLAQLASRSGREWARSVHQHMQARMRLLPGENVVCTPDANRLARLARHSAQSVLP